MDLVEGGFRQKDVWRRLQNVYSDIDVLRKVERKNLMIEVVSGFFSQSEVLELDEEAWRSAGEACREPLNSFIETGGVNLTYKHPSKEYIGDKI